MSLSSSPYSGGGFTLHHNGSSGGGDSGYKTSPPPSLAPTPPPRRVTHTALPTPPVDDMEPQSISFIGRLVVFVISLLSITKTKKLTYIMSDF